MLRFVVVLLILCCQIGVARFSEAAEYAFLRYQVSAEDQLGAELQAVSFRLTVKYRIRPRGGFYWQTRTAFALGSTEEVGSVELRKTIEISGQDFQLVYMQVSLSDQDFMPIEVENARSLMPSASARFVLLPLDPSGAGCDGNTIFLAGAGIADVTGPAAERGMMGYAMLDQQTTGIHMRLRSRAFVIASPCNGQRMVFVSADLGQVFQAVKLKVVEKLRSTYGGLYTEKNVALSATHTHSGPGGYSHYALYNLTSLGFDKQNFDAIVKGIHLSIVRAHNNVVPAKIKVNAGELTNASINRSRTAYARNPGSERQRYFYDVDKRMTLLRLQGMNGNEIGMLNWFAVHGTSMGNSSRLISGDNKGYASYLFEKSKGADYGARRPFVAAFAQSHEGDVSPNIYGGENGGGASDYDSNAISGSKQYQKAKALYGGAAEFLTGGIQYRHTFIDFSRLQVAPRWTDGRAPRRTCKAAIGISMMAGAEDGPGFGREGWSCENARSLWEQFTCGLVTTSCQAEKPIALETGSLRPHPWTPEVLPLQLMTIGQLGIVAVPFELSTMSGRRLQEMIKRELPELEHIVIAGLSNAYAGYVTTREEYAVQHYEGASTHFGPWTLAGLQQEFSRLAVALRTGRSVGSGPTPRDLECCQLDLQPGVVFDDKPFGKSFGSVRSRPRSAYQRGQTVKVTFWGGHPKNNLKTESTYLRVQRKVGSQWLTVARDWDPETKYIWKRVVPASSEITTEWTIPRHAPTGEYRIRHDGHWKSGWDGRIRSYRGTSPSFLVR